jgi:hypothetical protein
MKDLWKEKKIEQYKYGLKIKMQKYEKKIDDVIIEKKIDDSLNDKKIKDYIEKNSEDYAKDYIFTKTKKINIINKSSETTTDIKKLYVDKMITMFKQNVINKQIDTPSAPKWDSDSEDNASTDKDQD